MLSIKTVLVPTDFSEASETALTYGKGMAEAFGASLHLVHVMEDLLAHAWAAEVYVASAPNLREEIEREARQRLETMLPEAERERLRAGWRCWPAARSSRSSATRRRTTST